MTLVGQRKAALVNMGVYWMLVSLYPGQGYCCLTYLLVYFLGHRLWET